MRTTKQNILEGWLQDTYEKADSLLDALHSDTVPFNGDADAYSRVLSALIDATVQIDIYRAHCLLDYSEPDYKPESDPGPSQEQRS